MIPQASMDQYRRQQVVAGATASSVRKLWHRVGDDFDNSWNAVRSPVLSVVAEGRTAAVGVAKPYTGLVLAQTGQSAPPSGTLNTSRFLRDAPDGRDIGSLLDQSVIVAKRAVAQGATVTRALESAGTWLTGTVLTVLADTRRQVYHADIIQRPGVGGYARMLNAPSCSRCVILAGKWFAWNAGFQRHPRCDCIHIPASESLGTDFRTDPQEYFDSLSAKAQDKTFTKQGARAIRDGADIQRVTNIQMRGLGTAKAAARYGTPSRVTVDDIYRQAGTRTNAIRLLEREGYVSYQTGRLNLPA